jgi:hypothetical protein
LERYLEADKNDKFSNQTLSIKAWEVEWLSSTSARLKWSALDKSTDVTGDYVQTFPVFSTSQDAINYLNAMNKTAYSLASTVYEGRVYPDVRGHAPQP